MDEFQKTLNQIIRAKGYTIKLTSSGHAIGSNTKTKRKKKKKKERTPSTRNRKLKKLEARYRKLSASSEKLK
ncbi:hypothetical protein LCGC14_0666980, partial [marine sediment metagenome]